MTHPLTLARGNLVSVFQGAVAGSDYADNVDVFDRRPDDYAKTVAVVIGDATADVNSGSFAAGNRIQNREVWDVDVEITTHAPHYSPAESDKVITSVLDILTDALTEHTRLNNSPSLMFARLAGANVLQADNSQIVGKMEIQLAFRTNRRSAR